VELERSDEFKAWYRRLTEKQQEQVDRKLRFLAQDYRHPSLEATKWADPNHFYCKISRGWRLFYDIYPRHYELISVGPHDIEKTEKRRRR